KKRPCPSHRVSSLMRLAVINLLRRRSVFPAPLSSTHQRLDSAAFFFLAPQCAFDTPGMSIHTEPFLDGSGQVRRAQRRIARSELHSEVQNVRPEFVALSRPALLGQ